MAIEELVGNQSNNFLKYLIYLFLIILSACATNYASIIKDTESAYYSGDYASAIPQIRALANEADNKDRLLYLMEAGMIFHTKGDYESSIKAFKEAETLADNIKVSITRQGLSFLLSDNESNFTGEDFERVLIKFYIALDYIFLGKYDDAKVYFRRLDIELKEMKFAKGKYKQNLCARYLDAILSESLDRYNDARVQYKNIQEIEPSLVQVKGDRYVLAIKENDSGDAAKNADGKQYVNAYNTSMNPVNYSREMGEVIIINQAGKAATKESRGKILNDEQFMLAMRGALETAIASKGAAASVGGVLASMSLAENPVPIYVKRDVKSALPKAVLVNGRNTGEAAIYNDYSETAMQNFNENYTTIVAKNVASIAVKMVAAAVASEAMARSLDKGKNNDMVSGLIKLGAGALAGYAASQTIAPDLRSWRLLPSSYQIKRMHLQPGEYKIEIPGGKLPDGSETATVKITSGQQIFLNFRTYSSD